MKFLVLFSIRLYWKLSPAVNGHRCIFKESCSHLVYRVAKEEGTLQAMRELTQRWHVCGPVYHIMKNHEHDFIGLILCNGEILPKDQVSDSISSLFE